MDKATRPDELDLEGLGHPGAFRAGQRLRCEQCGSEIKIITPCTCRPPDQVLKCCGQEMKPVA